MTATGDPLLRLASLTGLLGVWDRTRRWRSRAAAGQELLPVPGALHTGVPWCSPNVWHIVADFYLARETPQVFEYGAGISSIWHLRNLITCGGTYTAVEHKAEWFDRVLQGVEAFASSSGIRIVRAGQDDGAGSRPLHRDVALRLARGTDDLCTAVFKLRPPNHPPADPEGSEDEFRSYAEALDRPQDVVIVDGRARRACVNRVLDGGFVRPGGVLALFDAGRGIEGWLGRRALRGNSDYQPVVSRMLSAGAFMMDGSGLDAWPGLPGRRSPRSTSKWFPAEACILVAPPQAELAR